jgi:ATP-dependent exoDNAse (exonuclease V) alpha subunit
MEKGICNGSTGLVIDFVMHAGVPFPIVQFSNGVKREIQMKYWQSEEFPVIAIGQLPLCHAWAMTIHKIQGATLSMAEMDIGNGIFECGQTYVALSRVKSLDGLYLTSFDPTKIKINPKVKEFYDKIPEVEYESVEETETETPPQVDTNIKKITIKDELQFEQYAYNDDVTVKKLSI